MAVSKEFAAYVIGQLGALGPLRSRRMFGALGLYCDEAFFALISSDVLYFRVDASNRAPYEARGMGRFRPYRDRPHISMNYYEVPAEVLEDAEECCAWARRSLAIAHARQQDP